MAAKKKTVAKKPAKRASGRSKASASRKPARAAGSQAKAGGRGGEGEVVYSDVLHQLRKGLVSRLIR
jgi:hypothetical protein